MRQNSLLFDQQSIFLEMSFLEVVIEIETWRDAVLSVTPTPDRRHQSG